MKFIKFFLIILILFNFNLVKAENENLKNEITKNLRCLICQGQSIYDSDSEFANSLKSLVKQKLDDGYKEKEIYDFLKDKYGQWITYEPEFNKKTFILWIMPILLFIIGGAILFNRLFVKKY